MTNDKQSLSLLRCLTIFSILLVSSAGCKRDETPVYTSNQVLPELADIHQKQIREAQLKYYGTPEKPTLRLPDESADGALRDIIAPERLEKGAEIYRLRCASCHGVTGDGNGEAAEFLNPKPRDYRQGVFKFTSTKRGTKPRRADLMLTIRRGAKGTSMPAFPFMPADELAALVDYVIVLSQRGEYTIEMIKVSKIIQEEAEDEAEEGEEIEIGKFTTEEIEGKATLVQQQWAAADGLIVLPLSPQPPRTPETVEAGRKAFLTEGCSKCHGVDGRGQTIWLSESFIKEQESLPQDKRVEINRDHWKNVAPAADLTAGSLHGGNRPIDLYRRVYHGINGTPMPGLLLTVQQKGTPEMLWHVVHFIQSVVEGNEFETTLTSGDGGSATPSSDTPDNNASGGGTSESDTSDKDATDSDGADNNKTDSDTNP